MSSSYCLQSYNSQGISKLFSAPINEQLDTSDRGLSHTFIGPGAVAIGLTGLKTRWGRDSSFSTRTEYTKTLSVPTKKKAAELMSGELGGCSFKYICEQFFFCENVILNICPSTLGSPRMVFCYSYTPCIFFSQCQTLTVTSTHSSSQIILIFVSVFTSLDSEMYTPGL